MAVRIEGLGAGYGRQEVLREISLAIDPGELVALLGPSGCGKSTLLRVVAGLHAPGAGRILFNGREVNGLPAERRRAAMVFQRPLLFPHLTVAGNVAFGLKMRRMASGEIRQRVAQALHLVQLEGYGDRRPGELSGGQEQRVALARALVIEPDLLLLDEPFSALDPGLRAEMQRLVGDLQRRLGITTIFVTHDQEEAVLLADRIAVLLDGRLAQFDHPRGFYTAPATPEVARFFGWQLCRWRGATVALRPELLRAYSANWPAGQVHDLPGEMAGEAEPLRGYLRAVTDLGWQLRCRVELTDGTIIETIEPPSAARPAIGDPVCLTFPSAALLSFV